MAEEPTTGGTPGAGGTPPQAGEPNQQQPQTDGTGGTPGADGKSADEYRELRGALEKERERARDLQARLKAIEEKDLPEAERTRRKLTELTESTQTLERQLREARVENEVIRHAAKLGFADPADAARLLDIDALDFDDKGKPKGVEGQLKALLQSKPYLASSAARPSGSADGGNRGQAPRNNDMNQRLREALGRS